LPWPGAGGGVELPELPLVDPVVVVGVVPLRAAVSDAVGAVLAAGAGASAFCWPGGCAAAAGVLAAGLLDPLALGVEPDAEEVDDVPFDPPLEPDELEPPEPFDEPLLCEPFDEPEGLPLTVGVLVDAAGVTPAPLVAGAGAGTGAPTAGVKLCAGAGPAEPLPEERRALPWCTPAERWLAPVPLDRPLAPADAGVAISR
jgi:hypothetical protein